MTDYKLKRARDLRPGEEVDLEGCPFIEEEDDMIEAMENFITVVTVGSIEFDSTVLLELNNMSPIYVPADLRLKVIQDG